MRRALLKQYQPPLSVDPDAYPIEVVVRFTKAEADLSREEFQALVNVKAERLKEGLMLCWERHREERGR